MSLRGPTTAGLPRLNEGTAGCQHCFRQSHRAEYGPALDGEQFGPGGVDTESAVGGLGEWLQCSCAVLRRSEQYDGDVEPGVITRMPSTACGRNDAHGSKRVDQTRDSDFEESSAAVSSSDRKSPSAVRSVEVRA